MAMLRTRVRRTCSPLQKNRSRGLVSDYAEDIDGGNDGARKFSLHALHCVPFQHSPECVNQPRVFTANACYQHLYEWTGYETRGVCKEVCWGGNRNCLTKM
jgi:hypothetical protein